MSVPVHHYVIAEALTGFAILSHSNPVAPGDVYREIGTVRSVAVARRIVQFLNGEAEE